MRARIPAIDHGACAPEGPTGEGRCTRDALGGDFDEEKLVGRVMVHGAAEEGKEDQKAGAENKDE